MRFSYPTFVLLNISTNRFAGSSETQVEFLTKQKVESLVTLSL